MLIYFKHKNLNHNKIEFNSITNRVEFNFISFYHFKQRLNKLLKSAKLICLINFLLIVTRVMMTTRKRFSQFVFLKKHDSNMFS